MSESILPHWLFLYGTMIVYLALGTAGLWLSGKFLGHGDPVSDSEPGPEPPPRTVARRQ